MLVADRKAEGFGKIKLKCRLGFCHKEEGRSREKTGKRQTENPPKGEDRTRDCNHCGQRTTTNNYEKTDKKVETQKEAGGA